MRICAAALSSTKPSSQQRVTALLGERVVPHVWSRAMSATTLWQVKSHGSPVMRCELDVLPDGRHRVRVVRGRRREIFVQQDLADRASAIQLSDIVYRHLKNNGFHDTATSETHVEGSRATPTSPAPSGPSDMPER